jgi:hypothetical protein
MGKCILIVNHTGKQCGVYQYGYNFYEVVKRSQKYVVNYAEINSEVELAGAIARYNPNAIIYNAHPLTMPWLTSAVARKYTTSIKIIHEINYSVACNVGNEFSYYITPDPTLPTLNPRVISIPRIIPEFVRRFPLPESTRIGSFGFGMANKGFERLINIVQNEFESAHISILMPFNDVCDIGGRTFALETAARCRAAVRKPGITLEIYHDFAPKNQLLDFLASNTINAFLYDSLGDRGISSTIDFALAVRRPIAITKSAMFRHISAAWNDICIESNSLKTIMERGVAPLAQFYNEWTEDKFLSKLESIFDKAL